MIVLDEEDHLIRVHKPYECMLSGCEGTRSRFAYDRIKDHLEHDHGVNTEVLRDLNILNSHVLEGKVKHPHLPCKTCIGKRTS